MVEHNYIFIYSYATCTISNTTKPAEAGERRNVKSDKDYWSGKFYLFQFIFIKKIFNKKNFQ